MPCLSLIHDEKWDINLSRGKTVVMVSKVVAFFNCSSTGSFNISSRLYSGHLSFSVVRNSRPEGQALIRLGSYLHIPLEARSAGLMDDATYLKRDVLSI